MEGVILSSWDYIMGPQIEKLFCINYSPKIKVFEVPKNVLKDFNISNTNTKSHNYKNEFIHSNLKTYSLMCGQILLGEIDGFETLEKYASRTFISDSKVLIGVVFRLNSRIPDRTLKEVKKLCFCVGLIYKRETVQFIFQNQFTIDIHLRRLADLLQRTKVFQETDLNEFENNVMALSSMLDCWNRNNLHCFQDHCISTVQDCFSSNILSLAIISHLQTSGHSAILGGSEYKINQVINILSMFHNTEELSCSLSINYSPMKYKVSSFCIQGIIKNSEKDSEFLLEHAYNDFLPLSVIDTDLCKVWQTWPLLESIEKNRFFSTISEAGLFVPRLLKDLYFADKNEVNCKVIIENFMKYLMMKASALIKTISHFRNAKRLITRKELMTLYAIDSFVDLQILLGCAEKLQPGTRNYITSTA